MSQVSFKFVTFHGQLFEAKSAAQVLALKNQIDEAYQGYESTEHTKLLRVAKDRISQLRRRIGE